MTHVVLASDEYVDVVNPSELDYLYAVELRMEAIAALSRRLWGEDSYYSDARYYERLVGVSVPPG